jgi:hypothetical protein
MVSKISPCSSKLIEVLVGKKYLAKHVEMTRAPPWLLHSLDML